MYLTLYELRHKSHEHYSDSDVITYHASGRLGDFIYQLGIIHQNYVKTGKKGVLYVSSHPESFAFGIERAYNDTKAFVSSQPYISGYHIHKEEHVDIKLSEWRYSPLLYHAHWAAIFNSVYKVDWGKTPWLFSMTDQRFVGKTLVHCSLARYPKHINFHSLFKTIDPALILFITMNPDEHTHFVGKTGYAIERFVPSTLDEFMSAVCSCEMFIGNLSSPLTYAYGFHKKSITLLDSDSGDNVGVMGLENIVNTTILSHFE